MPKVSVCVVTYNQEKYIRQCLQSIIDQRTDFDFEVIVGDDCSTDGTAEIVEEFANNYPERVFLVRHRANVGPTRNYLAVHNAARGEYIAHLDGDDCARPGKLQNQASCLDKMPDVSLVVHAVEILGSDKSVLRRRGAPQNGTLNDLLMLGTYFVHSSVMYRKSRKFKHVGTDEIVDFYFHVEHASTGNVYFDDGVLGCYRVHEGGISKNLKHREMLEKCYETAFDRALELGAVAQVVAAARMKRRMAFAIARCLAGDLAGYKEKIRLSQADAKYASLKHRLLHFSRFVPLLVTVYMWSKKLGMNA